MDSQKFLTDDERQKQETLLWTCLDDNLRDATMLLFAMHSGARANEMLSMSWQDFDLKTGAVRLKTLKQKTKKIVWREIAIPKKLCDALARLKALSPEKPFAIRYARLAELWARYRVTKKPLHSLRHTFAMRVYDRTKDIRLVQKSLGHSSIQNTMIYADYHYSAQEFKKLMRVR
jgi:integrase/recombinase XerC